MDINRADALGTYLREIRFALPAGEEAMLRNALSSGTGYGWEFVNVAASSGDPFSLYQDDWSPKPLIAAVDDRWEEWRKEIAALAAPPAAR